MLDIDVLPKNIKQICLDKIVNYEKNHKLIERMPSLTEHDNQPYNRLKGLKTLLKRDPPANSRYHLAKFRKYTEMLDKKRGNSFQKTFPELYELLEEDGSWRQ